MAWDKASLKLVLETDIETSTGSGRYRTKSKSFSNLRQNATDENCKAVANAVAGLQKYDLIELQRVDVTVIPVN